MSINKYDIAHGLRTVAVGLLIIGVLPTPLMLMGPSDVNALRNYFNGLLVLLAIAIVSQIFVFKYRSERNTSSDRKSAEKLYSIIGLSIIGVFFAAILVLMWIGS